MVSVDLKVYGFILQEDFHCTHGVCVSVFFKQFKAGRTADQVADQDGPWYPKVWPEVCSKELKEIETIVNRMPTVSKKFEERRKQLKVKGRARYG